ncbi:MAG: DUF202 domain-containing protein [Acidimicrobiales bacterium]
MPDNDADSTERAVGDIGMARERTDLAWNRSGLAVAATVAIVLRRLWPLHGGREDITLALIGAGGLIWAVGMRLGRRMTQKHRVEGSMGESACRLLTLGTMLLALAGFVGGIL